MNRRLISLFLALFFSSLLGLSCSKGSPGTANLNSAETAKQAEIEAKNPHLAPTIKGDVERMGLAVQSALDALKTDRWSEVMTQLNALEKELSGAVAHNTESNKTGPIHESLQELKPALTRTIKTAENRGKETEGQLRELQTRVNALKVFLNL